MITFEALTEKLVKKVIYRKGRRKKRKVTDRKGFKVVGGKETKMTQRERRNRKLSQRKGARKRKAGRSRALRQRKLTLKKRKGSSV